MAKKSLTNSFLVGQNILVETQDRSMRRLTELREQCALEKQAKAHLEENLRSDLDEKDSLIAVLQTKVKLLSGPEAPTTPTPASAPAEGLLVDLSGDAASTASTTDDAVKCDDTEVQALKGPSKLPLASQKKGNIVLVTFLNHSM